MPASSPRLLAPTPPAPRPLPAGSPQPPPSAMPDVVHIKSKSGWINGCSASLAWPQCGVPLSMLLTMAGTSSFTSTSPYPPRGGSRSAAVGVQMICDSTGGSGIWKPFVPLRRLERLLHAAWKICAGVAESVAGVAGVAESVAVLLRGAVRNGVAVLKDVAALKVWLC
eukprot:366357-Chlamydomonas_euryale.AAC.9